MEDEPNKNEQEIFDELKGILNQKYADNGRGTYQKIALFHEKLEQEFPGEGLRTVRLEQLLIGSTIAPEAIHSFDLPGGIIERFIREEL